MTISSSGHTPPEPAGLVTWKVPQRTLRRPPPCRPQDPLSYRFARAPPVAGARKDAVDRPAADHRSQRVLGEDETVDLYRMFALAAAESAALQKATEGLGKLPPIVSSASNLILFNSTENPYKKCAPPVAASL